MQLHEKEWFIQAPWGRICIVAWGNCFDPPVLVLHGHQDSAVSFRPLISLLPNNFYYVAMEHPGQGKSDHFPPGLNFSVMDLVYCIEVVRTHFRWEQFTFLAHSFAGTIGRLYNLTHPGKFSAVIELDQITPSLATQTQQYNEWYKYYYGRYYEKYHQINSPKETRQKLGWDEAIRKVQKNRPELTADLARATIERWSEPAGDGLIRFTFDPRWAYFIRPLITPEQRKVYFDLMNTPTLAVVTEDSIQKGLFKNTPFLLEDSENYKVRKVQGAHDVHIAHPERVAPFVSQFLIYGIRGLDANAKL